MSAQLAVVPKDRTAAERQRRYRQRRKVQKPGVAVTPAVATPTVTCLSRTGLKLFTVHCDAPERRRCVIRDRPFLIQAETACSLSLLQCWF
jgi:hypothetical protein